MKWGKRHVFGYFPSGTDPKNYSYAHKRKILEEQWIFGNEMNQSDKCDETWSLLNGTTSLIKNYLENVHTQSRKIVNYNNPDELRKKFDFAISQEATSAEDILGHMQDIADLSVANQHSRFFSALRGGADMYGIMWERLTAVMGTTMYTYEVAPLFTLMEEYVFGMLAEYIWRDDWHDGLMLPGGATCNLYGMQLARYVLDPTIHQSGLYDKKPLVVFTSDESHYSMTKSAMLMWLGKNYVIKVATNNAWEMLVEDLEAKIIEAQNNWFQPLMINATSGTTVLWAYDDITAISKIAKKYKIRLHVDAIRWGGVIFVDALRHKMQGMELADSLVWNPHKMMWSPIQCSVFMTKHAEQNAVCNALKSKYLFNEDKLYDQRYDTGDKYIQCGRKVDVVKLRLQWKARGKQWISDRIQTAFDNVKYMTNKIKSTDNLIMVQDPDCLNVCFWYIPDHLKDKSITRETIWEHHDEIHSLTAKIHSKILQTWEMMTMFTNTKNLPNFFRMAIVSPRVTHEDLDFVVEHIEELGAEVASEIDKK